MGDPLHRPDARPARPSSSTTGRRGADHHHLPPRRRRLGHRLPAGLHALRRRPGRRRPRRDERRGGDQGPATVLRRLRGRQHPAGRSTPAPSTTWSSPTDGRAREGHPHAPPQRQRRGRSRGHRRLLRRPAGTPDRRTARDPRHRTDTGSAPATPSSTWWTPTPGPPGIQPTGPHVCFAVADLDGGHRRARDRRHPLRRGAPRGRPSRSGSPTRPATPSRSSRTPTSTRRPDRP